jgi:murein DD-endopeptidase MepM/ murein hydrolase activator NlpD
VSKLGWTILGVIVLAVLAFASMLSFGSTEASPVARVKARIEQPVTRGDALVMPVVGVLPAALQDTWGDSRGGGARHHQAIDIPAAGGTPVLAAAAGTVEKLFQSRAGGLTVYIRSPDRGWSHYYAHLAGYAPGLSEGQQVRAGQGIGFVGDTGNAGSGNTHLHFGIARMRAGERWYQGEPVNPYPLLVGRDARR